MPFRTFLQSLLENPYFSAGFGLVGVGTGLAIARQTLKHGLSFAQRSFLITLEVPSKDKSYSWLLEWLSRRPSGRRNQHVAVETNFVQYENGEIATKMNLVPSTGIHYVQFRGTWMRVQRSREKNVVDLASGSLWETLTLTAIGRSRRPFEELLEEAREAVLHSEQGTTVLYTSAPGGDWRRFGFPRKRRPLASVMLAENKAERIEKDAREFLSSAHWYLERGIPYRRGYLLYGPPGCGKSSFIFALAGALGLNICVLSLSTRGISDEILNQLLNVAPQRSIILLEDIDAALISSPMNNHSDLEQHSVPLQRHPPNAGVTFSGLLNALDGVAASEGGGRILFMTTNHLERLHPALIRPGRVDLIESLDLATTDQIFRMFLKFYPKENHLASEFSKRIPPGTLSMAQLQAHFMSHKDTPQTALAQINELLELANSTASKR